LVGDFEKSLKETKRVLKQNGIVAWSVWGRPNNSPKITVPKQALQNLGLELNSQKERSLFHLHDKEYLRKKVLEAGFSKAFAWYQYEPISTWSGLEFANFTLEHAPSPSLESLITSLSPEQYKALKDEVIKLADELLKSGEPLGNEVLVVVAFS